MALPTVLPIIPQPDTQQTPLPAIFQTPALTSSPFQFVQRDRLTIATAGYVIRINTNTDFVMVLAHLRCDIAANFNTVTYQYNGDAANDYSFNQFFQADGVVSASNSSAATNAPAIAMATGTTADTGQFAWAQMWFIDLQSVGASPLKQAMGISSGTATFNVHSQIVVRDSFWNQGAQVRFITLLVPGGNFIAGSLFKVYTY